MDSTVEYLVSNGGSTPLWQVKTTNFANGDILCVKRACIVETGQWLPAETATVAAEFNNGWKVVSREAAFELFPRAFADMLEEKCKRLEAGEKAALAHESELMTLLEGAIDIFKGASPAMPPVVSKWCDACIKFMENRDATTGDQL